MSLGDKSILIVGFKSSGLQSVYLTYLRSHGVTTFASADSMDQALFHLANQGIDIIVCDPSIPPKGGLELVKAVRANKFPCKIVVPLLDQDASLRDSLLRAGADQLVPSIQPVVIFEAVAKASKSIDQKFSIDEVIRLDSGGTQQALMPEGRRYAAVERAHPELATRPAAARRPAEPPPPRTPPAPQLQASPAPRPAAAVAPRPPAPPAPRPSPAPSCSAPSIDGLDDFVNKSKQALYTAAERSAKNPAVPFRVGGPPTTMTAPPAGWAPPPPPQWPATPPGGYGGPYSAEPPNGAWGPTPQSPQSQSSAFPPPREGFPPPPAQLSSGPPPPAPASVPPIAPPPQSQEQPLAALRGGAAPPSPPPQSPAPAPPAPLVPSPPAGSDGAAAPSSSAPAPAGPQSQEQLLAALRGGARTAPSSRPPAVQPTAPPGPSADRVAESTDELQTMFRSWLGGDRRP